MLTRRAMWLTKYLITTNKFAYVVVNGHCENYYSRLQRATECNDPKVSVYYVVWPTSVS